MTGIMGHNKNQVEVITGDSRVRGAAATDITLGSIENKTMTNVDAKGNKTQDKTECNHDSGGKGERQNATVLCSSVTDKGQNKCNSKKETL